MMDQCNWRDSSRLPCRWTRYRVLILSGIVCCTCGGGFAVAQNGSLDDKKSASLIYAPQPSTSSTSPQAPIASSDRLQLSLQNAIRMALVNNLDLQIEQRDQMIATQSVVRANGGGTPRAISYNIAEVPAGEAVTPLSLLASTSSSLSPSAVDPTGVPVSSSYDIGHVLEAQHSLSLASSPFSAGAPVPAFDLALLGQFAWFHRDPMLASEASSLSPGPSDSTSNQTLGNVNLLKQFSSGASLQLGINDFTQIYYSGDSSAVPFTHPDAIALITQPLLRGAGRSNNTRFITIAKTNRKISLAVLEQQMISTVSGVETLYYDLVSLQDSVVVQEKALKAATILLADDREQLRVGHMAPIEVVRAQALVTATQLALTQANSLRQQQGNILRSVIDPLSLSNSAGPNDIVATDQISPPSDEPLTSIADLIEYAWVKRPDVRQAVLQIKNGELAVAASANERLPEVDVYGEFQTRGTPITGLAPLGGDPVDGAATFETSPVGGRRSTQNYEIGVQFNLPVQNRVAKADHIADRAQLQEQQLRLTQLKAQVAAEVRNAVIGLAAAKEAAIAAASSRKFQEDLLAATTESFQAGMSTNFAVVEQQTYLAQAETTEVAAQAAWKKAAVQLARAVGDTLQQHGIELTPQKPGAEPNIEGPNY